MAAQADIDKVKLNLPTWRDELAGWNDVKIGTVLDSINNNVFATCRLFWLERVSDTAALTDISDSGSSRPLTQAHQHAIDMLAYWDKIAGVDATSVGKIRRRYHRRKQAVGLSPYGGVYARTD